METLDKCEFAALLPVNITRRKIIRPQNVKIILIFLNKLVKPPSNYCRLCQDVVQDIVNYSGFHTSIMIELSCQTIQRQAS